MKRQFQAFVLAAALAYSATAFAGNVQTDYNHTVNFSQYKTYSWGQVKTTIPFFVTRVQNAINQQLQAKGWTLTPAGGAVTVFATDNIHNQQEIQTMYDGLGGGWGGGWGWGGWGWGSGFGPSELATTTTSTQSVGNLVVDIFDGNSKKILWRGLATGDLSSNDVKNTKELDGDITKMFKNFPPKPGK